MSSPAPKKAKRRGARARSARLDPCRRRYNERAHGLTNPGGAAKPRGSQPPAESPRPLSHPAGEKERGDRGGETADTAAPQKNGRLTALTPNERGRSTHTAPLPAPLRGGLRGCYRPRSGEKRRHERERQPPTPTHRRKSVVAWQAGELWQADPKGQQPHRVKGAKRSARPLTRCGRLATRGCLSTALAFRCARATLRLPAAKCVHKKRLSAPGDLRPRCRQALGR